MKKILQNAKPIGVKIINGTTYKMRVDIGTFCRNRFEANIIRIILFNNGRFIYKFLEDYNLDVIIDIDGILFNHKNAYIYVDLNIADGILDKINNFRMNNINYLYIITSKQNQYKVYKTYEQFQNQFKDKIPLWETSKQNVDKNPDLYKKQWTIGKKEIKRKHKKFFQPKGESVKIGQLWKKQPFKGRPYYDKRFIDTFKVYDSLTKEVIFEHTNWGSIILAVRRYMRDHAIDYYNKERFAICAGRIKKTQEWVDIIKYDTMTNHFLNCEHFI